MIQQQTTNNQQLKKGFTLIELLIVISIITILITVGLTSFATSQKKARDSKRKSDLKEVQNSLEQYYAICGYSYPTPEGGFYTNIRCLSPNMAIMPTVPQDPKATPPYFCPTIAGGTGPGASSCHSIGFKICAKLEGETTEEYCLTNQQ